MRIIVEGCDGVGKSTLTKALQYHLNKEGKQKHELIHLTSKDPTDYKFYSKLLNKKNVIFDRQFLSEIIYTETFNRKVMLKKRHIKKLTKKIKKLKYKVLILVDEPLNIMARQKSTERMRILVSTKKINSEYLKLGMKLRKNNNLVDVIDIDKTDGPNDIIKNYLEGVINE